MLLAQKVHDRLSQVFYAELFAYNPELRDLFPVGMEAQRSRLLGALIQIVGNVTDKSKLVPYLKALGSDHRKFGVITRQGYDVASPRSDRDLLCICAGTGVAPVLAAVQELEQRQDGRRVHIFYAGRDRDRLYALPHLESVGVRYRRLTVVPVVSPEGPEDRSPDVMGNVVASYGDWRRHQVFVAGPTSMVQSTLDRLREQGVAESQIFLDDYGLV